MSMMYVRNLIDLHLKYYTDFHYVDEDMSAIPAQGGQLDFGSCVGIANRDTNNAPNSAGVVASMCRHLRNL